MFKKGTVYTVPFDLNKRVFLSLIGVIIRQ